MQARRQRLGGQVSQSDQVFVTDTATRLNPATGSVGRLRLCIPPSES